MRVVFSLEALAGLELIGDHIAEDNPRRAASFVAELRAAAEALTEFPQAFALVPRYQSKGVRRRVHGDYLILYAVETERVLILPIIHGAMDYSRLLGGQGGTS